MGSLDVLQAIALTVLALVVLVRLARTALSARVHIDDFAGGDENAETGLPHVVHSELEMLREEGGGATLRFMAVPDGPVAIPEPLTNIPGLASAIQLVKLLPRRVHTVRGHIHTETVRGAALSVRLDRSETLERAATLYADDFLRPPPKTTAAISGGTSQGTSRGGKAGDSQAGAQEEDKPGAKANESEAAPQEESKPDEPKPDSAASKAGQHAVERSAAQKLYLLSVAASAWVAFHLPSQDDPSRSSGMLTASWLSYAHFRIGAILQQAKDEAAARHSYGQALLHDPLNRGALHNLAGLDIGDGCNGPAFDRLAILCELQRATDHPIDRLWYRARLNLAVAYLNSALPGRHDDRRECSSRYPADAQKELATLAVSDVATKSQAVLTYIYGADEAIEAQVPDAAAWRTTRRMLSPELVIFLRNARDLSLVLKEELGRE